MAFDPLLVLAKPFSFFPSLNGQKFKTQLIQGRSMTKNPCEKIGGKERKEKEEVPSASWDEKLRIV